MRKSKWIWLLLVLVFLMIVKVNNVFSNEVDEYQKSLKMLEAERDRLKMICEMKQYDIGNMQRSVNTLRSQITEYKLAAQRSKNLHMSYADLQASWMRNLKNRYR